MACMIINTFRKFVAQLQSSFESPVQNVQLIFFSPCHVEADQEVWGVHVDQVCGQIQYADGHFVPVKKSFR